MPKTKPDLGPISDEQLAAQSATVLSYPLKGVDAVPFVPLPVEEEEA